MLIHEDIRKEVISLIQENLPDIQIYNGRTYFTDVETQLPAITVSMDNAECKCIALGGWMEWEADLYVSLFIPMRAREVTVDALAENIAALIFTHTYQHISRIKPEYEYQYDYDDNEFIWTSATLTFHIEYGRKKYF